jgi:hypothetical protein
VPPACTRYPNERSKPTSDGSHHRDGQPRPAVRPGPQAVRACQQVNQVYAILTSYTDPLFRSMADGLADLDRT